MNSQNKEKEIIMMSKLVQVNKKIAESNQTVTLGGAFYSLINGVFLICDCKLYAPL